MKFSFVLPAYKGRFLKESIDSILAQDYKDFELIVVDDCSPDDIDKIVTTFNDHRLSYHRNKHNIGGQDLVTQWNHCLSYATGDYVILATDDDLYEPSFLSTFVQLIEKYPEANVFRSRILDIDKNGKILWFDRCYKEFLSQGEFFYYYFQGMKGGIPQFIFKLDSLIAKGGFLSFPMAWGSDDATALLLSEKGVVNSQEMLVRFRWSDINISSDHGRNSNNNKIDARIKLCKWLKEQINNVYFEANDIGRYCRAYVIDNIDTHLKNILLKEILTSRRRDIFNNIKKINKENIISKRGVISIAYRYFRKNIL